MCANDWTADDIGWGPLLHRGEVSQSYLWRSGQVRGYSITIVTARHVAEPTELTGDEAAALWRDTLTLGRALESHHQPLKMNYLLLGNAIPHAHFHMCPRRGASADPAPGGPLPEHGGQQPGRARGGLRARTNSATLSGALSAAGLINYDTEWWHWSAGDRYWALQTRQPAAFYGPVELP
ncbi:histidine triad (HIT) protein [Streptomyces sp. NPDC051639]|uniref:histidine triad (HIT) protein n=1 Tax=unclassified Streptomyces TaxID=2593676 RepID=UPI00343F8CEA